MIINIRLTEEAIEYVSEHTGVDRETAEEIAQMVISLSEISGSPTPKHLEERKLLRDIRSLIDKYKDENDLFYFSILPVAIEFGDALEQYIDLEEEGR